MSKYEGKEEKGHDLGNNSPDYYDETGLLNYRRIIPQLMILNARLWMKVELADRVKIQVAEAMYNGRLETIAIEEQALITTIKRLRSYVHIRNCLGGLTGQDRVGELERLVDPSAEPSALFPLLADLFKSVKDENELLEEVTWEGDQLRSDPLALVLWLEIAGIDKD
ncbi:MAG: hypothetical protein GX133_00005 [Syntrophomonadaceae bacterium]|nr:hypothetical protein [Syntrophomonadaceae bacterium]